MPTTCSDTEQVCASAPEAEIGGYCGNTLPVKVTPVVSVSTKASTVSGALSVASHNALYKLPGLVLPASFKKLKVLMFGKPKSSLLRLLILRQQILPSPKSWANSSRISNSNWDNTRLLAQCRTRNFGNGYRHIKRAS